MQYFINVSFQIESELVRKKRKQFLGSKYVLDITDALLHTFSVHFTLFINIVLHTSFGTGLHVIF